MKNFPSICIDDFYDDPDKIREFALSLDYISDEEGKWPGKRTKSLDKVDPDFFQSFCVKMLSVYYDFMFSNIEWKLATFFQLVEPYSNEKKSPKNTGWIHFDDCVLSGIIYLTPNINPNCGTSLYRIVNDQLIDKNSHTKQNFHLNSIDENYDEILLRHNSAFEEVVRFQNIYNRMISFEGNIAHGANNFFDEKDIRLTQVFFLYYVNSESLPPLQRFRKYVDYEKNKI